MIHYRPDMQEVGIFGRFDGHNGQQLANIVLSKGDYHHDFENKSYSIQLISLHKGHPLVESRSKRIYSKIQQWLDL